VCSTHLVGEARLDKVLGLRIVVVVRHSVQLAQLAEGQLQDTGRACFGCARVGCSCRYGSKAIRWRQWAFSDKLLAFE